MSILTGKYLTPLMPFYDRDEEVLKEIFDTLDSELLDEIEQNLPLLPSVLIMELWEENSCYA